MRSAQAARRAQSVPLCRIIGQLVRLIAYGVIKPLVHITSNEIQRGDTADSLAIGLPERAIDRLPGFQIGAFFPLTGAANHLAETRLSEVGSDEPAITHLHPHARVRLNHAPPGTVRSEPLVRVPPKVRQLSFVSPDHEQRRSWADLLLPASTGALVILTQRRSVSVVCKLLTHDLSTAQLHLVDTAWRAAVPNSISADCLSERLSVGELFPAPLCTTSV